MYYQFLAEDLSGASLIEIIMEKIRKSYPDTSYNIKPFKGIGGFTKKNTVKETKTGKLLNDLTTYLKGFNRSLQGLPATIVVVLDNDKNDPEQFRKTLENVANQNMIQVDHVFCLAIEEIEAWLLGDQKAVLAAYPKAKTLPLHNYVQDSICGTWEVLADALYNGGQQAMKRLPFYERGKIKDEWARKIGVHLNLTENKSPSFNFFFNEIYKRAPVA